MAAKTDWIHRFGVPSGKRQGRTFVFGVGVALAPAIGGIGVGVLPFWVERDAVELWEAAFPGGSAIAFLVGAGAKVLFSRGSAGGGRLYGTLAVVITGGGMALILFALGSGVGVLAGAGRRAMTLGAGVAGETLAMMAMMAMAALGVLIVACLLCGCMAVLVARRRDGGS